MAYFWTSLINGDLNFDLGNVLHGHFQGPCVFYPGNEKSKNVMIGHDLELFRSFHFQDEGSILKMSVLQMILKVMVKDKIKVIIG